MTVAAAAQSVRGHRKLQPNDFRQSDKNAEPRALAYALFSRLSGSPFDFDDEQKSFAKNEGLADVFLALERELPYDIGFAGMSEALKDLAADDWPTIRRAYSSRFEVGDSGPTIPLRAELVRVRDEIMKEELIRFYNFFSYELSDKFAWAPDHVSVLLEFMQLLCVKEANAKDGAEVRSLARAQLDFMDRHIVSWLPVSIGRLTKDDQTSYYSRIFAALWAFLEKDRNWNHETLARLKEEN